MGNPYVKAVDQAEPNLQMKPLDPTAAASPTNTVSNLSLGIQIAQCRQYLQTLGFNVGIICILGSLGYRGSQGLLCRTFLGLRVVIWRH